MVDAAIIGPDIMVIKEQSFLYCNANTAVSAPNDKKRKECSNACLHRLKLVTGVEISTRLVKRSGRLGKTTKRTSRRIAAPAKIPALPRRVTDVDMASLR